MTTMNNNAFGAQMIELNVSEIEEVAGGPFWVPVLIAVGAAAGTAVVGEAAVGFVDGLIKGFQDDE